MKRRYHGCALPTESSVVSQPSQDVLRSERRRVPHLIIYHCCPPSGMGGSKGLIFLCSFWQPKHFPESDPVCPPFIGSLSDADFRVASLPVEAGRRKTNSSAFQWSSIFSEAGHCQIM